MRSLEYYNTIRQQLHEHPDVSGCEQFAHDLVVRELQRLNPDELYNHVGGFGVVAFWKSAVSEAKTLAFRADIDALPIGHRCGHDGHATILLRFAEMVAETPHRPYHILLIFQPEEETGLGAQKIVKSGILQRHNVQAIFGLHNLPGFPLGTVVLNPGTFAAASTGVIYRLQGRETHASTPEKGVNPGMAIAEIIQRFHSLTTVTETLEGFRQSTLICSRIGEEAFGTSAGSGEVMFTLRAYTNTAMSQLVEQADAIVEEVAQREHLQLQRAEREPFRATENDAQLVERLHELFSVYCPVVYSSRPFRWSEDFADYLLHFRGAFFGIGSGEQHPELHHPDYHFPDALIEPASHCFELIMNNIQL